MATPQSDNTASAAAATTEKPFPAAAWQKVLHSAVSQKLLPTKRSFVALRRQMEKVWKDSYSLNCIGCFTMHRWGDVMATALSDTQLQEQHQQLRNQQQTSESGRGAGAAPGVAQGHGVTQGPVPQQQRPEAAARQLEVWTSLAGAPWDARQGAAVLRKALAEKTEEIRVWARHVAQNGGDDDYLCEACRSDTVKELREQFLAAASPLVSGKDLRPPLGNVRTLRECEAALRDIRDLRRRCREREGISRTPPDGRDGEGSVVMPGNTSGSAKQADKADEQGSVAFFPGNTPSPTDPADKADKADGQRSVLTSGNIPGSAKQADKADGQGTVVVPGNIRGPADQAERGEDGAGRLGGAQEEVLEVPECGEHRQELSDGEKSPTLFSLRQW